MINIQTNCFPAICISFKDRIKDQIDKEIFETFLSQKEKLTIRNVRCILVGCGGAGKTTLLGRLKNETYKDLKNIETTELVDVHANNFVVYENENTIKSMFLFSFFIDKCNFFRNSFMQPICWYRLVGQIHSNAASRTLQLSVDVYI